MNSKKSMTKVLLLIFIVTMSMSFLTSAAAATNSESEGSSILTADYGVQVWLHDVDDWSYIQSVKIVMTGVTDPIELSRKAGSIIYEAPDGIDYQFDKITQIIVKTSDGDQIFAPACEHGILGWWSKKIYYHVWVAGPNPIQLTKTVAPAQVYAGATVTYTFTVSNNGKLPLKDVSLTDPMFGSTPIWTDDYMASGDSSGSIVVTATAPSPAAEALPYTVNNTATVTATQYKSCEHENYCEETGCYSQVSTDCGDSDCDGDCDECVDRTVTDTASASYQVIPTPVTPDPKLTLTKGVNVSQTTGGQPVVYTFVLTNTGNVALQDITLTDAMLQTAIDSAGVPATLPAGGSFTFTAGATSPAGPATVTNVATINANYDSDPSDAVVLAAITPVTAKATYQVIVIDNPAIQIVKTVTPATGIEFGDELTYHFSISNIGNVNFTSVLFQDALLDSNLSVGALNVGDGPITFDIPFVANKTGEISNTAVVTGYSGTDPSATDEDTVAVNVAPIIRLTKSVNLTNVLLGTEVTYSFTVTNPNDISLYNVTVTDPLFDTPLIYSSPIMTSGASATFTKTYSTTAAAAVYNTATAEGWYYTVVTAAAVAPLETLPTNKVSASASASYTQYTPTPASTPAPTTNSSTTNNIVYGGPYTSYTAAEVTAIPAEEPVPAAPVRTAAPTAEPTVAPVAVVSEEVPAEPAPAAPAIPKTGGFPAAVLGGLGALATLSGLLLLRKANKKE